MGTLQPAWKWYGKNDEPGEPNEQMKQVNLVKHSETIETGENGNTELREVANKQELWVPSDPQ